MQRSKPPFCYHPDITSRFYKTAPRSEESSEADFKCNMFVDFVDPGGSLQHSNQLIR